MNLFKLTVNKTFQYQYILFYILILILSSCTFNPDGEYFNDLEEPGDIPEITVDLNFTTDTVIVENNDNFRFNFITDDLRIHFVKFYIDGILQGTFYEQNTGIYSITRNNGLELGTHEITLETYTSSGSGSIADGMGVEGFLFSNSWTLILLDNWSYGLNISSVIPDSGSLKISWDKFQSFDFKSYVVLKTLNPSYWPIDTIAIITDQNTTTVYDNNYVGESVFYKVNAYTEYDREYRGSGMSFEDSIPEVKVESVNNNHLALSWNESYFINNIDRYEIYTMENYTNQYELATTITDPTTTSYIFDSLKFAIGYDFLLISLPKELPCYLDDLSMHQIYLGSKTEGRIGDSYNGNAIMTPIGDYLYYKNASTIYEYNFITDEITDSIYDTGTFGAIITGFSVSPNRKYMITLMDNSEAIIDNIETDGSITYTTAELTGTTETLIYPVISDNGMSVIHFSNDNNIVVYDFENQLKIYQGLVPDYITGFNISSDGKYFYQPNGNRLYEIMSDTIVQIWEGSQDFQNSHYVEFDPLNPELIILEINDNLVKKNILTQIVEDSYSFPNIHIIDIDHNLNKVLGASDDYFRLYELNTQQQIWSYPTSLDPPPYTHMSFCYNAIYNGSRGLKLTIE